jgi:hypothetical protein
MSPSPKTRKSKPDLPMRPMTEAEIEAAARADPDAQPWTEEQLAKAKRVPRAKLIRRALGCTQEEFAAHYHRLARCEIGSRAPLSRIGPQRRT